MERECKVEEHDMLERKVIEKKRLPGEEVQDAIKEDQSMLDLD